MMQVDETFEVAAARDEVFRAWTDFGLYPLFMTGVESVYAETQERLRWQLALAGAPRTLYVVITEMVPGERLAWMSVDATTMVTDIRLEEIDAHRTRVHFRIVWSPRGEQGEGTELDELTVRCDLQRFRALVEEALEPAA